MNLGLAYVGAYPNEQQHATSVPDLECFIVCSDPSLQNPDPPDATLP